MTEGIREMLWSGLITEKQLAEVVVVEAEAEPQLLDKRVRMVVMITKERTEPTFSAFLTFGVCLDKLTQQPFELGVLPTETCQLVVELVAKSRHAFVLKGLKVKMQQWGYCV
jgi:hypothetical protein